MRVSVWIGDLGSVRETIEQAIAFEQVGLDTIWVPELWGFDAPTMMGYLAARTTRVQIGASILPIYSRTPALLAQTAAGLDYLSSGRAILGLGSSGPQVVEGWHGVPFDRPVERTREVVAICRAIWRREVLAHHGRAYALPLPPERGGVTGLGKSLRLLNRPVRARIPIYLAALGQRAVELAAEVADGWLPLFFLPEKAEEVWGAALARGRARRSTALDPLEVVAGGMVAIGEGLEHLRETDRHLIAFYVGGMGARGKNFYKDLFARYGYEHEAARIQELFLSGQRAAAAAAVPADLLEHLSLVGPPAYVRERIAAYRAAGVTVLDVRPVGPDPVRTLARVMEWASAA